VSAGAGEVTGGETVDAPEVAEANGRGLEVTSDAVQAETSRAKKSAIPSNCLRPILSHAEGFFNRFIA
jgi:hypothetical protein